MKKLAASIMAALICLTTQSTVLLAAGNMKVPNDIPKIYLNGSYVESEFQPIINEGRVLVPLRAIGEALDMSVEWNEQMGEITLQKRNTNLKLTIDSNMAIVNGQVVTLDTMPQIIDNHTFVPLRFIGESLGLTVCWDDEAKSAILQEKYYAINESDEVTLIPTNAEKDSPYMIYHGMKVIINGLENEYSWDWQASNWQYITYAEPNIYWADVNGDNEDEIIIVLTDGVNRGTGVLFQDVHILDKNGAEIMIADAKEYAPKLALENGIENSIYVTDWTYYKLDDGQLIAEVVLVKDEEQFSLKLYYSYIDGEMKIDNVEYVSE